MKVEEHAVVLIHYVLTNNDKEVLDSSEGQDPLAYLHGTGHLIPGLEAQLLGKVAGDKLNVTVQPGDGYGEFNKELVQTVPGMCSRVSNQLSRVCSFRPLMKTAPVGRLLPWSVSKMMRLLLTATIH